MPEDMATDDGAMSDHVQFFIIFALKEHWRGHCLNMQAFSVFTHIYPGISSVTCCNICTVANTVQILLHNVAPARNPQSMQLSDKGCILYTAQLQPTNSL